MPKNGGPMRQPVSNQGMNPKIVPGAMMKKTSDPSPAQKRRMVAPSVSPQHTIPMSKRPKAKKPAKRKAAPDSSQIALSIVERATVEKLASKRLPAPRRKST